MGELRLCLCKVVCVCVYSCSLFMLCEKRLKTKNRVLYVCIIGVFICVFSVRVLCVFFYIQSYNFFIYNHITFSHMII
jgi:hypothetical protein